MSSRVASVRGLQEPLRQLAERIGDAVPAELEVSRRGLAFRVAGEPLEKNNPFRRIAVWSALKLQVRRRQGSSCVSMLFDWLLNYEGYGVDEVGDTVISVIFSLVMTS